MLFRTMRKVIAFALVLSIGAATEIARAAEDPARGDFIGQLRGLDRGAIAISTDSHNVLAYVCDGTSARVTVAQSTKNFNGSVMMSR
jgi:hypothetical protein